MTMKTTFNALIVPAHLAQPVRIEIVDTEMEALQKLVEGNIESLTSKDWHVYLNDEGSRLPQNVRAEVLAREAGISLDDTLNGTAVFLGHGGRRSESDAPGHLIRLAEQLFDAPLAA
jgi:hypothetical protein